MNNMRKIICILMAAIAAAMPLAAQVGDENDSLSAAGLHAKGLNAERLGLTELAERYYRRALEAPGGDESGLTQQQLGILLEQKEYYADAAAMLSRSGTATAMAHQAFCLIQLHLLDSAWHCAERALEADTASALAMTMMAYVETERDHHINAIAWANRAPGEMAVWIREI